jgi:predicted AAA+ superfamily ATPase
MRKLEANVDKTTLSVDRLSKNMGGLNNSFGEMVEHLVAPNIVSKFNELGYHFKKVSKRTEFFENGQVVTEVDLLLENEKTIAIIEIKSSPTTDDIEKHLKRMQIVRRDFERSRDTPKELIGAVAGAIFPDNIKRLAIKNGFYVITQTDDTVKIDVPENFKPKIF